MRIDVHLHIGSDNEVLRRLDVISQQLGLVIHKENVIMSQLTDALDQAEAAAKANSDAEDSIIIILNALATEIAALKQAGTDPATLTRITALGDALKARTPVLAAAAVANTPAA